MQSHQSPGRNVGSGLKPWAVSVACCKTGFLCHRCPVPARAARPTCLVQSLVARKPIATAAFAQIRNCHNGHADGLCLSRRQRPQHLGQGRLPLSYTWIVYFFRDASKTKHLSTTSIFPQDRVQVYQKPTLSSPNRASGMKKLKISRANLESKEILPHPAFPFLFSPQQAGGGAAPTPSLLLKHGISLLISQLLAFPRKQAEDQKHESMKARAFFMLG
ncbi:hypothetical protein N657DRAFT_126113 [Parathielavia appendiculata]|uniref:Uncharacterized protein n=1 Tax=Parathielavia appendiculata TaxID=2587402 RepID=A0AAN6TVA9_9PEZI|nr:hypothetical protein N657DRAFT_126113 [Parathielavia appendiculata]